MAEPVPEAPAPRRPGRGDDEKALPDHVTVPLLTLITQRSLDADYEHVAARRRASGQTVAQHPVPRRTAALVLLAFGLLVTVAAVQTSRNAGASNASRESLIEQVNLRREGLSDVQRTLNREESQLLSLKSSYNDLTTETKAAQAHLERLQARAGFAPAHGPGIQVTVNSAPGSAGAQLVRDSDLTLLTDALWVAGAEAISVNGHRLTVLSAFRNVGVGVLLNSRPINPPYVFDVIGNPDRMPAALLSSSIGEKWYALKDSLGFRFDVRNGGTMTLPAAEPERLRSAQVAGPDTGHTRTQGDSAP
ncbi:MAG TPA: DUF881 domain-containing protein [Nocardioides sp.]|uniref:DUF881 domain-containing protein n=1 Tax=Nocardioides sp. TaxID=35761 RepID=UPI002F41C0EB